MLSLDYQTLFEEATDGIFIADAEGRVLDANPVGCVMLGYSREELKGVLAADLLVDESGHETCLAPPSTGQPSVGQRRVRRKDGTLLEAQISGIQLPTGQYVGIVRNLTGRASGEDALRSTLEWFRLIVEQVPAVLWTTDKELRFTSGMGTALKDLGITTNRPPSVDLWEYFQTNDPEFLPIQAHRRALSGESTSYEQDWGGRTFTTRVEPLRDEHEKIIGAIGLAQDITERRQAELQLQKAKDELEQKVALRTAEVSRANEDLRSEIAKHERTMEELRREEVLLRQVLDLHEGDRRVLAYEIHDGLVQYVTGALMRLEAFREGHGTGRENAWNEFDASLGLLRETVAEARRLISGLRPPILDEAGIADAIDYLASEHRQAGLQVEAAIRIASKRLASPLETAIFRIVQESLTNIRRHSQSERAMIDVTEQQNTITLRVRDWGVGFRPDAVDENSFGLRGIRERVRLLGGRFQLRSAPGEGTTVEVDLPTTPPHS